MSRDKAEALGCTILATIGAQASYGIDMKYVLVAPIWAVPKCLEKEGITTADIDLYEINEAFSGSTVAVLKPSSRPGPGQRQRRQRRHRPSHRRQRLPAAHKITLLHEMVRPGRKRGLVSSASAAARPWP